MNKYKKLSTFGLTFLLLGLIGLSTVQATPVVVNPQAKVQALPAVIEVGVLAPLSGDLEALGPGLVDGVRAAAFEINASSDFDFDIHLQVEDTGGVETTAVTAYTTLKAAGVELIIGAAASAASTPVANLAKDDHIVQISYASTAATLSSAIYTYFYRTVPTDALQSKALASLIDELDFTNIAVVHRADDYGTGFGDGVSDEFEALGGTVSDQISYPADTTDFAASVTSIKAATDVDAIALIAFISDGAAFITETRAAGVDLPIFGTDGIADKSLVNTSQTTATIVEDAELVLGTKPHSFKAGEGKFDDFIDALSDASDAGIVVAGKTPTIFADYAYDAMWVGALAVQAAGSYDGALINAEVQAAGKGFVGATGNKTFDAVGDTAESSYDIFQFQDGVLETVGAWSAGAGLSTNSKFKDPTPTGGGIPGFGAMSTLVAIFGIGVFVITLRKRR